MSKGISKQQQAILNILRAAQGSMATAEIMETIYACPHDSGCETSRGFVCSPEPGRRQLMFTTRRALTSLASRGLVESVRGRAQVNDGHQTLTAPNLTVFWRATLAFRAHITRLTRATAYHEAGHVVIGLVLDVGDPQLAEIWLRDVSVRGVAHFAVRGVADHSPRPFTSRDELENAVKHCLAGPVAEARASRRRIESCYRTGGQSDVAVAQRLCSGGTRIDPRFPSFRELELDVRVLVHDHWATIARVARALQTHKRLDADDLRSLVRGARRGRRKIVSGTRTV